MRYPLVPQECRWRARRISARALPKAAKSPPKDVVMPIYRQIPCDFQSRSIARSWWGSLTLWSCIKSSRSVRSSILTRDLLQVPHHSPAFDIRPISVRCHDDWVIEDEFRGPDPRGCDDLEPWQTTFRGLATYTIPKIDVLVSTVLRSQPSMLLGGTPATSANWVVPNSVITAALGHLPPGATATGTTTIPLVHNDMRLYADERRTQPAAQLAPERGPAF